MRVPFPRAPLLLACPAAIKVDHKMASKALPAQEKKRTRTSSSSYATLAAYVKCVFGLFSILITDPWEQFPPLHSHLCNALAAIRKLRKLRARFEQRRRQRCHCMRSGNWVALRDLLQCRASCRAWRILSSFSLLGGHKVNRPPPSHTACIIHAAAPFHFISLLWHVARSENPLARAIRQINSA